MAGHLLDTACWVQADLGEAGRRGIARDGGSQEDIASWHEWDLEEAPFMSADRPWTRARAVLCGTPAHPGAPFDSEHEVLVGRMPAERMG
jgi:hypothetical protein